MRILGIDPGLERVGFGILDREGSRLMPIHYGLVSTPKIELADRLLMIHEQIGLLIDEYRPDVLVTERLLFTTNKTTAMDVSKALGVILLCACQKGLETAEYSPPSIKLAVAGIGSAEKKQVQFMVAKLLSLPKPPRPDDVADALAVAICHALHSRMNSLTRG